jgi:hypothetical protein
MIMGMVYMENEIKKNETKNLDMTYKCNVCNKEMTNSMDEAIAHMISHGTSALAAGKHSIDEQKDTASPTVSGANTQMSAQVKQATTTQASATPSTAAQPSAQKDKSAQQPEKTPLIPAPKAPVSPIPATA